MSQPNPDPRLAESLLEGNELIDGEFGITAEIPSSEQRIAICELHPPYLVIIPQIP